MRNVREELKILPSGILRCTSSNDSDQYFVNGKYISKTGKGYVQKVAQREYDEKLIPSLERVISKLKEIETIYNDGILENCFQKMCSAKKLVAPFIEPMDMKIERFMNEVYEPSGFEEKTPGTLIVEIMRVIIIALD